MNTSNHSNRIDPLHVSAAQQQESNMEMEIAFCSTRSATEWDRRRQGEIIRNMDRQMSERQPSNSLQGEEGVLCPLGLLVGAPGGTGRLSRVSSGGRRGRVSNLGSLLQKLVKLCKNNQPRAHQLWMTKRSSSTHC